MPLFFYFSVQYYGFSGFAKEVTSCSHAKTVIPRASSKAFYQDFLLEEYMTSLVSLPAVIC